MILAWAVTYRPRWVQIERGVLHAVIFVAALASSIVLSSNGYVRTLGIILALVSLFCAAYRVVVYPFDPHSASGRLYASTFQAINLVLPWYRLSTWGAVFNLGALRVLLREKNLHDTSTIPVSNPDGCAGLPPFHPHDLVERNMDGYYNDLNKPAMGSASDPALANEDSMYFTKSNPGARFGRNVPLAEAFPDEGPALLEPNPRVISNELLARRSFIPAPTLNFLAAAWIQFETHDWFNHGEPITDKVFDIALGADDPWRQHGCPMHIRHTRPDPTRDYDKERAGNGGRLRYPPTYVNAESHWWDASQIYGSNHETTRRLRTVYEKRDGAFHPTDQLVPDGKLFLDDDNLLIDPANLHVAMSGFVGNWWAGLSLLHTLFAREHNAICDTLKLHNPDWDGDRLFNAASHDQLGADGEDPHGGMDAGDSGASDAGDQHERQLVGAADRASVSRHRPDQRERGVQRHAALRCGSHRRRLLPHRGIRLGLSHASADARRPADPLGARRTPHHHHGDDAGRRRQSGPVGGISETRAGILPTCSIPSASPIPAPSRSTTFPTSCASCDARMARSSTSPPSMSCAIANAVSRATIGSAASCT